MGKESKTILELDRITPAETDQVPVARPGTTSDDKITIGDLIHYDSNEKTITFLGRYKINVSSLIIITYLLDVKVKSGQENYGSVTGSGSYNNGDTATIKATPSNNYKFVKWEEDDDTNSQRSITVNRDMTFTAVFAEKTKYNVTIHIEGSGVVKKDGDIVAAGTILPIYEGDTLTLTAEATGNNRFSKWTDIDSTERSSATYTFTINDEGTVTAFFVPNTYNVITSVSPNNSGTVTKKVDGTVDNGPYSPGTTVDLYPMPNTDLEFEFKQWGDGSNDDPKSLEIQDSNISVQAIFEQGDATRFIGYTKTPSDTGSTITEKYRNLGLNELKSCIKIEARKGDQKQYTLSSSEIDGNQKKMFFVLWKGDNKPVNGSLYRSFDQTTETYTQNQIISEEDNTYFTVHKTFDNGNGEIYHLAGKIELFGNDTLTIQF